MTKLEKGDFISIGRFQSKMESLTTWNTFVVFAPYRRHDEFKEAGVASKEVCESLEFASNGVEQWWVAALDEDGELVGAMHLRWRFEKKLGRSVIVLKRGVKRDDQK